MNAFMNVYTSIECECIPPHRPLFLIPLFPRLSTPAVYLIHECVCTPGTWLIIHSNRPKIVMQMPLCDALSLLIFHLRHTHRLGCKQVFFPISIVFLRM